MSPHDRDVQRIHQHIDARFDEYLERLRACMRQQSISSLDVGVKQCAELVLGWVRGLGADADLVSYDHEYAQPIVYGRLNSRAGTRTLVNYQMYDTMPVPDPENWISPPWEARIVNLPGLGGGAEPSTTRGP